MEEKAEKPKKRATKKAAKPKLSLHEQAKKLFYEDGKTDEDIAEVLGLLNANEASRTRRKHNYKPLKK